MKKLLFVISLLFLSCYPAAAQDAIFFGQNGGTLSLDPGWTYIQVGTNGFACSEGTSCDIPLTQPTTAGSALVVTVFADNDVTIEASGGFSLCPASACHTYHSGAYNLDSAYDVSGTAARTSVTVTLSGDSGGDFLPYVYELLPPPGYTASYDGGDAVYNASCDVCPIAAPAVTGTDAVVHFPNSNTTTLTGNPNLYSAPYLTTFLQTGLGLNITSAEGSAGTFTVSTPAFFQDTAISLRSTAAGFTPPTSLYTLVSAPLNIHQACGPTCTITVPATQAGHLLMLAQISPYTSTGSTAGSTISTVSGGGTWVIPTGPGSCYVTNPPSYSMSIACAYVLSSTAGTTTINITMDSSNQWEWDYVELAPVSGTFRLDTQGGTYNSSSSATPPGQALTLNYTNDAIFQFEEGQTGDPYQQTLYPMPAYGGGGCNNGPDPWGAACLLLDTKNGAAPLWQDSVSEATVVSAIAFNVH